MVLIQILHNFPISLFLNIVNTIKKKMAPDLLYLSEVLSVGR